MIRVLSSALFGSVLMAAGAAAQRTSQAGSMTSPWPGGNWTPAEADYGVGVDLDIPVTMSDGTVLRADVAYPTDKVTGKRVTGRFPILLTQTPYVFRKATDGNYFVERGYIFVTAHVRGTGKSPGQYDFFSAREKQDGAEFVRWAVRSLPNSSGIVGLEGKSYAGLNQIHTLAALGKNSPVRAAAPTCMGAELYRETYFAGGIPTQTINFQREVGTAMGGTSTAKTGVDFVQNVSSDGPIAFDGDYWHTRSTGPFAKQFADADVPALLWSSNNDIYSQSSLELYAYLQNAHANRPTYGAMAFNQKATGRYQIVMGQGGHCENIDQRILLEWFDTWLKGAKTGIAATSMPLHVHELGSNRWFNSDAYPVVPAYTRYYLDAGNSITATAPAKAGTKTIAWTRPDKGAVLRYETAPMRNGATLAGPISASIYASSTTTNLELIATIETVASDGAVTPLSKGTLLASLAANDPDRSWVDRNGVPVRPYGRYMANVPITPGSVNRYDFAILPRFAAIAPGSKLRVTFTTQTPAEACSPTLGVDPCFPTASQEASLRGSIVTIYSGDKTPSAISLPLLPAKCWQSSDNPGIPYWNVDPIEIAGGPCQRRERK